MLLHVSTFKMSSSESSLCLAKLHTDFLVLVKYSCQNINFNKVLIVQRNKRFAYWLYMQALLMSTTVDTGQARPQHQHLL